MQIPNLSMVRKNIFFFVFLAFYISYNIIYSIIIDFESKVFLPFRYEGLLHFKNAIISDSNAFFFIRDWSTSFLPEEHPLLYFHNPDLIHFFAGFIQYFFPYPKIILFILALFFSGIGLYLIWTNLKHYFGCLFTFIFIVLLVLPFKAFLISPQNLFISIVIFSIVWNFIILRKIWYSNGLNQKLIVELFLAFSLVAVAETNLNLILILITLFTVILKSLFKFTYTLKSQSKLKLIFRSFVILVISGLPALIFRIVQFCAIHYYGYSSEYIEDIKYSYKQKVQSNIGLVEAIDFYSDRGINFFGQGEPQTILGNIKHLTSIYAHQFNLYLWIFMIIISLSLLIISKSQKFKRSLINNDTIKIDTKLRDQINFLCTYLISYIIATYIILFISGDAIIKLSMCSHAFCDNSLIFRAIFIMVVPWLIFTTIKKNKFRQLNFKLYILPFGALVFFVYLSCQSFAESKKDVFSYKKALKLVPPNVDVITNFEPSVVAIETGSRVSMCWFVDQLDCFQLTNSKRLLKMYKKGKTITNNNKDIYVFLVFYHPYGQNRDILEKRYCIEKNNYDLIYLDNKCGLYKLKVLPKG